MSLSNHRSDPTVSDLCGRTAVIAQHNDTTVDVAESLPVGSAGLGASGGPVVVQLHAQVRGANV